MADCQWYYRGDDTNLTSKRKSGVLPNELFCSSFRDSNPIASIVRKVVVHRESVSGSEIDGDYFCQYEYDPKKNKLSFLKKQRTDGQKQKCAEPRQVVFVYSPSSPFLCFPPT